MSMLASLRHGGHRGQSRQIGDSEGRLWARDNNHRFLCITINIRDILGTGEILYAVF
jgi:hypothetical protein